MRVTLSIVLFLLIVSLPAFAGISILRSDDSGIACEITLDDLSMEKIKVAGKHYTALFLSDIAMMSDYGKPLLPVQYLHVALPLNSRGARVTVKRVQVRTIAGIRIIPVFEMGLTGMSLEEDALIYGSEKDFPGTDYEILGDHPLVHQRVVKIAVYPFQYNPAKGELSVCSSMVVQVEYQAGVGGSGVNRALGKATERRLERLLLNYDHAVSWRDRKGMGGVVRQSYEPWYRITVTEDGMHKIGYEYLRDNKVNPDLIDPRTIKIYNGGSAVLQADLSSVPLESDTIPYQLPIFVGGEEDGSFDEDDYIIFYGLSLSGWQRCSVSSDVPLYYNPFTDKNSYWLTWGGSEGKRMEEMDGTPSALDPFVPSCFMKTVHLEENHLCPSKSGFGWVWEEIVLPSNVGSIAHDYSFSADNLYTDSFELLVAVYGATASSHGLEVQLNGIPLCDTTWSGINYTAPHTFRCGGTNLVSGENTITLRLHKTGGGDDIYVDYLEVLFWKNMRASSNEIEFATKDGNPTDTTFEFRLYNFTDMPSIFDVTLPFETKRITDANLNSGIVAFQDYIPPSEEKRYIATRMYRTPGAMIEANPFSLRGAHAADYIIVTHPKFYYAAARLLDWRREHLHGIANPKVKLVLIDEVYDNFGWGLADPVALRNFIYYAANYWGFPPAYVLLFGGGSYDYRNLFGSALPKNYIPVHETGDYIHFQELMSHNPCFEDYFADLDGDFIADIPLGRFTVITEEEAADVVDKVIRYESGNLGGWKNNVLLVADDEFDDQGIDGLYRYHVPGCEDIARFVPAAFDVVKVYLTEFPGTNPGTVPPGSKPQARSALMGKIDKGNLFAIFLGHGNLRQLTHELAFYRSDIGMLENDFRGPFFYFGSCSVGNFDRPDEESIADLLQKKEKRGAIATLACTRTSGYSSITVLGRELADTMLSDRTITVGDGVLLAKYASNFGRTYAFFGDPATPLFSCDTLGIQATISADTLFGRTKVTVQGQVVEPGFNGFLSLRAFDGLVRRAHAVPTTGDTLRYKLPGNAIFEGIFTVTQSAFTASFFVPSELDTSHTARISLYAWGAEREGRGTFDSLVTGYDDSTLVDTVPPSVRIYHKGKLISDGMAIPNNAEITGILEDESGIDITERDNRAIYLAINEDYANLRKLNDYFAYDINSATRGSFPYTLGLDPDAETVKLEFSCYDNCRNQAIEILNLSVYSGESFLLGNVYNFPNPFAESTYFTYTLSHRSEVTLMLFTLTGKVIYQRVVVSEPGFSSIFWDGRDADGDRVANGVYLYKIRAQAADAQQITGNERSMEYTGKIAVAR
jgi:hypothetical protein